MDKDKINDFVNNLVNKMSETVKTVIAKSRVGADALQKGDTLTFVVDENTDINAFFSVRNYDIAATANQEGRKGQFINIPTQEGRSISATRIIRVGNGIALKGATPDERLKDFVTMIVERENNTLTLIVDDVIEVPLPNGNVAKNVKFQPVAHL